MLVKGMVIEIIEAGSDRILFEEWSEGMPRNTARIFRITPDEVQDGWPPSLTIEELKPKEVK